MERNNGDFAGVIELDLEMGIISGIIHVGFKCNCNCYTRKSGTLTTEDQVWEVAVEAKLEWEKESSRGELAAPRLQRRTSHFPPWKPLEERPPPDTQIPAQGKPTLDLAFQNCKRINGWRAKPLHCGNLSCSRRNEYSQYFRIVKRRRF